MKLGLKVVDFLGLTSTNYKLHLAIVRHYIWPSVQGDISLRPELFVISQVKTQLYHTLPNLYHVILLLHAFLHNQSELEGL